MQYTLHLIKKINLGNEKYQFYTQTQKNYFILKSAHEARITWYACFKGVTGSIHKYFFWTFCTTIVSHQNFNVSILTIYTYVCIVFSSLSFVLIWILMFFFLFFVPFSQYFDSLHIQHWSFSVQFYLFCSFFCYWFCSCQLVHVETNDLRHTQNKYKVQLHYTTKRKTINKSSSN